MFLQKIAEHAQFFSFGTNDLTQMTFGYSRDDVSKFLPAYLARGILQHDPFEVVAFPHSCFWAIVCRMFTSPAPFNFHFLEVIWLAPSRVHKKRFTGLPGAKGQLHGDSYLNWSESGFLIYSSRLVWNMSSIRRCLTKGALGSSLWWQKIAVAKHDLIWRQGFQLGHKLYVIYSKWERWLGIGGVGLIEVTSSIQHKEWHLWEDWHPLHAGWSMWWAWWRSIISGLLCTGRPRLCFLFPIQVAFLLLYTPEPNGSQKFLFILIDVKFIKILLLLNSFLLFNPENIALSSSMIILLWSTQDM